MWQVAKNYYHLVVAFFAALIFNFPSKRLIVVGVTGTDGKTTTVNMIYHILKSAGKRVSIISSVNARIGQNAYDTGFHVTTPDPWQVQKLLKQALEQGSRYFVFETTSHGLDQNRLAFVDFKIGVLTNITHEHLDYHKTWENYAWAKAKLFKNVGLAILNKGDVRSWRFLLDKIRSKIISYSLRRLSDINLKNFPIKLKIKGEYNLSNALAAAGVCQALGIEKSKIIKALADFEGVVGRMENVDLGQDFRVIVDFAHTPNGLEQALKTIRSEFAILDSRIIAVFGSAGQRDQLKRPLMGKIASKYADLIVLTAEDPRTERTEDICRQIAKGIRGKEEDKDFFIIADRKDAIEFAIRNLAKEGDIVATFGKSHEKSMCYGKKEYPWDEFEVVKEAIRQRLKLVE